MCIRDRFIGCSIGTNVLVGRFCGAKDSKNVSETVHTSILFSIVCGCILIFLGVAFARPMLEWMATPPEVLGQAVLYMRIFFVGMPAMMLYNFGAAVLRATGDTQRPVSYTQLDVYKRQDGRYGCALCRRPSENGGCALHP